MFSFSVDKMKIWRKFSFSGSDENFQSEILQREEFLRTVFHFDWNQILFTLTLNNQPVFFTGIIPVKKVKASPQIYFHFFVFHISNLFFLLFPQIYLWFILFCFLQFQKIFNQSEFSIPTNADIYDDIYRKRSTNKNRPIKLLLVTGISNSRFWLVENSPKKRKRVKENLRGRFPFSVGMETLEMFRITWMFIFQPK